MFNQALLSLSNYFSNLTTFVASILVLSIFLMEVFFIYNIVIDRRKEEWYLTLSREEFDTDLGFVLASKGIYLMVTTIISLFGFLILLLFSFFIYVIDFESVCALAGLVIFILINYLIYKASKPKQKSKKRKSKR